LTEVIVEVIVADDRWRPEERNVARSKRQRADPAGTPASNSRWAGAIVASVGHTAVVATAAHGDSPTDASYGDGW